MVLKISILPEIPKSLISKQFIKDILSEQSVNKRNLFNYNHLQKMITDNLDNKIDASYTIFSILCIEIWFQIFIDKKYNFHKNTLKVA